MLTANRYYLCSLLISDIHNILLYIMLVYELVICQWIVSESEHDN